MNAWTIALTNFAHKPEQPQPEGGSTKLCPVCGKAFHYTNITRRYCSEHCRSSQKAKREKAQRHERGLLRKPLPKAVPKVKRHWSEVFGEKNAMPIV